MAVVEMLPLLLAACAEAPLRHLPSSMVMPLMPMQHSWQLATHAQLNQSTLVDPTPFALC
jgi:hypothetical protein